MDFGRPKERRADEMRSISDEMCTIQSPRVRVFRPERRVAVAARVYDSPNSYQNFNRSFSHEKMYKTAKLRRITTVR